MDENWKKVSKIIIIYRQYDCKIFENNFKTITNNKIKKEKKLKETTY